MPVKARSEQSIQTAVVNFAKAEYQMIVIKLSTLGRFGTTGWPDYLFLHKGRVLFIEFKAPGKKSTPLQALRQANLAAQGFVVKEVSNIMIGKNLIDEFAEAA